MNEGILSSIFDDIENMNNIPQDEFKTCLESIESDLAELDSIDQSIEEAEKASFESIIEDINLFNSLIAYRNIKSGVALESVSSEFGIANEGIKELAEKGIDGLKAIGKKILAAIKSLISLFKSDKKIINDLEKEVRNSKNDMSPEAFKYDLSDFSYTLFMGIVFSRMLKVNNIIVTFNTTDFDPILKPVIENAIEFSEKYSHSNDKLIEYQNELLDIRLDTESLEKAIQLARKLGNDVKMHTPSDFDYRDNAIRLLYLYKRLDLDTKFKSKLEKFEKKMKLVEEAYKDSIDKDKIDSVKFLKYAYQNLMIIRSTYHQIVRILVLTCRKYKKDYKDKHHREYE